MGACRELVYNNCGGKGYTPSPAEEQHVPRTEELVLVVITTIIDVDIKVISKEIVQNKEKFKKKNAQCRAFRISKRDTTYLPMITGKFLVV